MSRFILGSQSPRRFELLTALVGESNVEVAPPLDSDEAGFEGLANWPAIEAQLQKIARDKFDDVAGQVQTRPVESSQAVVITADTIIVAIDANRECVVLGKPPQGDWQPEVRRWFHEYLIGGSHFAATAVCVGPPEQPVPREAIVKTQIAFRQDVDHLVDWYLKTNEPVGKSGGYAIQGAGSIFVKSIEGSLSNVVGLPLKATQDLISEVLERS